MELDTDYDAVKVKFSSKIDKKAPVFLADFSCGQLNNKNMEFECFKFLDDSEVSDRTAKRILIGKGNHLTHSGPSGGNFGKGPIRYFVGVHNKRTGKMKLHDAAIFHLKPDLPDAEKTVLTVASTETDYWENRTQLTDAFGSKASKRALNTRRKLGVNDNSLEGTLMEDSPISHILQNFPSELPQELSYLPVINRDATSVHEVFNIIDVISPEEDSVLENEVEDWLNMYHSDPDAARLKLCKFAMLSIDRVLDDPIKLKYLLYYTYMVNFQHLNSSDIRKKDPASHIPQPFKQHLLNKFTSFSKDTTGRQSRIFPLQMKDKLIAYILVLALFINDYFANIDHILVDLKRVGLKHFTLIAQNLGCHILTQKLDGISVKSVQLKLPLSVPPLRFSKRQY